MNARWTRLLFLTECLLGTVLFAQREWTPLQSYSDWMHVQRQAKTNGLPVLVFFCGPEGQLCEESKKQLEEEAILNYTEARFIRTKAFLEDGPGGSLADHWAIDFVPALLILDDKGRAVGRWMGRSSSAELLAFIKESRKRATQYDGLMKGWKNDSLSTYGLCSCAALFDLSKQYTAAKQAGDECIRSISPALYLDPAFRPFIMEFGWDLRLPVLPYLIAERERLEEDASGFPLMEYYTQAYRWNLEEVIYRRDSLGFDFLMRHLWPQIKGQADVPDSVQAEALFHNYSKD